MTERRWEVYGLGMVRREVATAPDTIKLCWVDRNDGPLTVAGRTAGEWHNGLGRALKLEPTHWTIWVTEDPLAEAANA